jgi:holo-[acyl-carrier protein] synthase
VIVGIGTDLVQIRRIAELLNRFGDKFVRRVLTLREQAVLEKHVNQAAFLAKRFAAKEAVSKALASGIGAISWQDIDIYNTSSGAPGAELLGNAHKKFIELGGQSIFLSLSDERDYALALVVISG